jgi:hypothetical protein
MGWWCDCNFANFLYLASRGKSIQSYPTDGLFFFAMKGMKVKRETSRLHVRRNAKTHDREIMALQPGPLKTKPR